MFGWKRVVIAVFALGSIEAKLIFQMNLFVYGLGLGLGCLLRRLLTMTLCKYRLDGSTMKKGG